MLYELFSWMCGDDEAPVTHQETATLLWVTSEHELGLKSRKQLIGDLHGAKFGASFGRILL